MNDFILKIIQKGDFLDTIIPAGLFILGPVMLFMEGVDELKTKWSTKNTPKALLYIGGSLMLFVFDIWVGIRYGTIFLNHARDSFGPWAYGFLIAVAICAVAFPISYIGSVFRRVWDRKKLDHWGEISKKLIVLTLGGICVIVLIVGLLFHFASTNIAVGFSIFVIIALAMGWFGQFLFPK